MRKPPDPHYRYRFPAELISHAVWPYLNFCVFLIHRFDGGEQLVATQHGA